MLKNYTTTISASKSIGEIMEFLVDVGATDISQQFEEKNCIAVKFIIHHQGNSIVYKLEANPEAAYRLLLEDRKRINPDIKEKVRKQAFMTAWRILRDWVDAQCALIKLEQATPLQLFLSYVYHPEKNQTFYEQLDSGKLQKLLN